MRMGQFKDEFSKQMKGKSAQTQMDLVIGLVKDLQLKGNESTFIQKLRKALKINGLITISLYLAN